MSSPKAKSPQPKASQARAPKKSALNQGNHLAGALLAQAQLRPKATFLSSLSGHHVTYGQVSEYSAQVANVLVGHGLKPGDRVAAQVDKSPEALALYLGVVRAGGVFLPLNTAYTEAELDYFLGDAGPIIVVGRPAFEPALQRLCKAHGVSTLLTLGEDGKGTLADLMAKAQTTFKDVGRGPDDLAAILYTSGTTGRSKGAMLSHENLASNARTLAKHWQFTEDDALIHALPIFHTHGLFVATNTALVAGASLLFEPKFDLDQIFALIPKATATMGVPTFYVRLLQDARLTKAATKHMRLFVSGSAPLLADTHRAFTERTGHAILERYGMTETNMITSNPYEGARVPGSVGFPLADVQVRITEPQSGEVLPADEIGMIEVKGPNVFKGYWRNEEKTKAEFRSDGFFITGDLGKIDKEGYVHIVGRGKDLVISGGYNVYPKEIEAEIDALDEVVESAVIGVPHADFGEGVTAVVIKKPGVALTEKTVLVSLKARLANYKLPKRVIFVDELPRNAMGKVQKNVLRDTYKALYS